MSRLRPPEGEPRQDLRTIDDALIRLRRLWGNPSLRAHLEQDVGEGIALSQVLVVDAVARPLPPAGPAVDAAAEAGEVTVGVVADRVQVERSTASRLVDAAVRAGLVCRRPSLVDGRRTVLALTPEGHRLLERAVRFRVDYLEQVTAEWSPADRRTFARLLARFADTATGPPGTPG